MYARGESFVSGGTSVIYYDHAGHPATAAMVNSVDQVNAVIHKNSGLVLLLLQKGFTSARGLYVSSYMVPSNIAKSG
jgi:hypothetical protein